MKKSYKADIAGNYRVGDELDVKLAKDEVVYISEENVPSNMTLTDEYKTVDSSVTDAANVTVIKTIEEIKPLKEDSPDIYGDVVYKSRSKFVTVQVTNGSGADDLVVGATLKVEALNSAETVLQTRNFTLPVLAADAVSTVVLKFDGIYASDDIDFKTTIVYIKSATGETAVPTMVIDISDVGNKSAGATFIEGVSVAATNPIVTNIQLVDKNGDAITDRELVTIYLMDTLDSVTTETDFGMGTNGAQVGILTAEGAIVVLSEENGRIDITTTAAETSSARIGIKLSNGDISYSDYLIWS